MASRPVLLLYALLRYILVLALEGTQHGVLYRRRDRRVKGQRSERGEWRMDPLFSN